jgi:cyclic-di-GMP-binding protein
MQYAGSGRFGRLPAYGSTMWYNRYMASTFSFDIVSDYNLAEVINAVDQASRELGTRYDLKGTSASLEFSDSEKTGLKVVGDSQYAVDTIIDIVRKKFGSRGVSQKVLDTSKQAVVSNLKTTQEVPFKKGLDQDKAKKVTALIRDHYPKVKAQIQGAEIRVSGPKKDELQAVMQLIEQQDFDFPVSFTNYR